MGRETRWQVQGYSVAAMRDLARRALPRPVFDFADGGAEDEVTLRRNGSAFAQWQFVPRPLSGSPSRDLTLSLFGRKLTLPVIIGPTGLAGLFWPGGEIAAAKAASEAGTAYCLSHGSVCTLEELAAAGASPRWMQVFIYRDRGFTEELVHRSRAAAYDALVLTIDNQLLGKRERDLRNGFAIPPRFTARDTLAMAGRLAWLSRMRSELPRITFGNYVRPGEKNDLQTLAGRMGSLLDPGMSWRDVAWLRSIWSGPLILKGVLHPKEAAEAVAHGIDGIIVSNHGGRQLDGAISAIDALPAIARAVDGRVPILLDGGVRRGSDVVKALALGAQACLIGRPHLWGLAVAGQAGVAHVLDIFRHEIDRTMGLLGVTRLDELTEDILFSFCAGGTRA